MKLTKNQSKSAQVAPVTPKRKDRIPAALREQVWLKGMGRVFEGKCPTTWCNNTITVFDFESGHCLPESKEGKTVLENLVPICSRCNKSMSNTHTFDEWCKKYTEPPKKPAKFKDRLLRFFICHEEH